MKGIGDTMARKKGLYARDIAKNTSQYVENVVKMYQLASAEDIENGRAWYGRANRFCQTLADGYGRTLADVAGIMSCLSPATSFEQNVVDTVNMLAGNDHETVSTYGPQYAKALDIRDWGIEPAGVVGENKTAAFWLNIVNPTTDGRVTVDRHSARVAVDWAMTADDSYYYINTPAKYRVLELVYRTAAEKIGILPHVLQAITWITYRRLFVPKKNGDEALQRKRDSIADHDNIPF